jgi:hypothetical protein
LKKAGTRKETRKPGRKENRKKFRSLGEKKQSNTGGKEKRGTQGEKCGARRRYGKTGKKSYKGNADLGEKKKREKIREGGSKKKIGRRCGKTEKKTYARIHDWNFTNSETTEKVFDST